MNVDSIEKLASYLFLVFGNDSRHVQAFCGSFLFDHFFHLVDYPVVYFSMAVVPFLSMVLSKTFILDCNYCLLFLIPCSLFCTKFRCQDLIGRQAYAATDGGLEISLKPYQSCWLSSADTGSEQHNLLTKKEMTNE